MKPVPFTILMLLLAAWGLYVVHQRVAVTRYGYVVRHLENERRQLLDDNQKLQCEIAALVRPERIAGEVRRLGLDLVDPVALRKAEAARLLNGPAPQTGGHPQTGEVAP